MHTYVYIKIHLHSRRFPLLPTNYSLFLFYLSCFYPFKQARLSKVTRLDEWKMGSDEKIEGKGQQKDSGGGGSEGINESLDAITWKD